MSCLSNLNGVFKARPGTNPKAKIPERTVQKCVKIANNDLVQEQGVQTTRRLALGGLASLALIGNAFNDVALAEDNGFWITSSRIPNPTVDNKITNEKTGTRSFIKKGLFMADIGVATRMYRIRKCAFDLLAMEDLIDKDKLNYVQKYLRMKSTFMYFDFDRVITAAKDEEKQPLLDLANKFFDNVEELESATREWNIDRTETVYKDTKIMLEEIMERMGEMYSNS